jgi:DNA-binding phage protein
MTPELESVVASQHALTDVLERRERAAAARDAALVRARKTGTSPTELARLTGLGRSRIYQILERSGLTRP